MSESIPLKSLGKDADGIEVFEMPPYPEAKEPSQEQQPLTYGPWSWLGIVSLLAAAVTMRSGFGI